MRTILTFLTLLFVSRCYSKKCQGTCDAMDEIAASLDATCTKSWNCLILNCGTPSQASQYGAVAKPRLQIYPCETPVIVNIQAEGSFFGTTFHEDRNFTGDTDYQKTISVFGTVYQIYVHVKLRQFSRKIQFKLTVSYGTNDYTIIPKTDIPIDKSGCEGVSSTTQNPLCVTATTTQMVTTAQTGTMDITGTMSTLGTIATTGTMSTTGTMDTTGTIATTGTMSTTGTMDTTGTIATTGTMVTTSAISSTASSTTNQIETTQHNQIVTNNSVIIANIPLANKVSSGTITGIVTFVVFLVIGIILVIHIVFILFLVHRRRRNIASFKYSNMRNSNIEL